MKSIWQKTMSLIGLIFVLVYGSVCEVRDAFAEDPSSSNPQAAVIASATKQCPTNLSSLQPKMEKALQFVKSDSLKDAILASLQASIPDAIAQSDGLARQITFLKQAIVSQERERAHAEKVAREGLTDSSQPLKPCRHRREEAYCYAMDQYVASTAVNLAYQEFLAVLQCYHRKGVQ